MANRPTMLKGFGKKKAAPPPAPRAAAQAPAARAAEERVEEVTVPGEKGLQPQVQEMPEPFDPKMDYLQERITDLMMPVPYPIPQRGIACRQPQGSEVCRIMMAGNNANVEWSNFFCSGNSAGCAGKYQTGALMEARPQGIIFGRPLIESFWKTVHSGNPGPIRYTNVRMRVIDTETVTFSSDWTFDNMRGIIMLETWKKMGDGTYELDEDRFKIEEVYKEPKPATMQMARLGLRPIHVVNEIMEALGKRIDMYNAGDVDGFVKTFAPEGVLTIDPMGTAFGHDEIRKRMCQYITKRRDYGNGVFSYTNLSVKVLCLSRVHISADWNLGEKLFGYVNCLTYQQFGDTWLVTLDDHTMAPTEFLY